MTECLFCKIVEGSIPADIVYSDDYFVAFKDVHPQAPLHSLVIPRRHVATAAELADEDPKLVGRMITVANRVAVDADSNGYRLVFNTGRDGGQTVDHVHLHVLGGRQMLWPPG